MTAVSTCTEARPNLASLLDKAINEGEVRLTWCDGQVFMIKPERITASPLDIESVDLAINVERIVHFIAEGQRFS